MVAEGFAALQEMRQFVEILARQEQVEQRRAFQLRLAAPRGFAEALRHAEQPTAEIDRPQPVGRVFLVIVEQHAHGAGGLVAVDLRLGPLDQLPVLFAYRSAQGIEIQRQQQDCRQALGAVIGPHSHRRRQAEYAQPEGRGEGRGSVNQEDHEQVGHGDHGQRRHLIALDEERQIDGDRAPADRPQRFERHALLPVPPQRRVGGGRFFEARRGKIGGGEQDQHRGRPAQQNHQGDAVAEGDDDGEHRTGGTQQHEPCAGSEIRQALGQQEVIDRLGNRPFCHFCGRPGIELGHQHEFPKRSCDHKWRSGRPVPYTGTAIPRENVTFKRLRKTPPTFVGGA